jgi:hypothetical protein
MCHRISLFEQLESSSINSLFRWFCSQPKEANPRAGIASDRHQQQKKIEKFKFKYLTGLTAILYFGKISKI